MPEFNFGAAFLETVGLEGESVFLQKEYVHDAITSALGKHFQNRRVINVIRDASAEMIVESIRISTANVTFSSHTNASKILSGMGRNPRTIGYEYYTEPLSISDMEKAIIPTMFTLIAMGDSVSERAATHIHVGFAQNLRLMKRLLRICLAIDPVLFRLGGMGGVFRGWKNNAAYARPLMNSVAVKVDRNTRRTPRPGEAQMSDAQIRNILTLSSMEDSDLEKHDYVRIINPIRALEAKTLEEFWASFGISAGNVTKYHPSRYTGVNFFAILAHGTIEFRHPNASLDPQLVLALIKFLRAMVEVSTVCSKEEIMTFEIMPCNQQVSMEDSMEVIMRIINLCRRHDVENLPTSTEMDILVSTLELSTFSPLPEIPVISHIPEWNLHEKLVALGGLIRVENILPSSHVDIHTINNQECSIFDSFPEAL